MAEESTKQRQYIDGKIIAIISYSSITSNEPPKKEAVILRDEQADELEKSRVLHIILHIPIGYSQEALARTVVNISGQLRHDPYKKITEHNVDYLLRVYSNPEPAKIPQEQSF